MHELNIHIQTKPNGKLHYLDSIEATVGMSLNS